MADLIHINRGSLKTEPSLARSWTVSPDGRQITLELRKGIRFSDGVAFDADDVLFSFRVYEDEKTQSPQRTLLMVAGRPIEVEKINPWRVRFSFAAPYAGAQRGLAHPPLLPRHLLEKEDETGKSGKTRKLHNSPDNIA